MRAAPRRENAHRGTLTVQKYFLYWYFGTNTDRADARQSFNADIEARTALGKSAL
jgi:hypothetical protein